MVGVLLPAATIADASHCESIAKLTLPGTTITSAQLNDGQNFICAAK